MHKITNGDLIVFFIVIIGIIVTSFTLFGLIIVGIGFFVRIILGDNCTDDFYQYDYFWFEKRPFK